MGNAAFGRRPYPGMLNGGMPAARIGLLLCLCGQALRRGKRDGQDNWSGCPHGPHPAGERSVGRGVTWRRCWTSAKTGAAVISLVGLGLAEVP